MKNTQGFSRLRFISIASRLLVLSLILIITFAILEFSVRMLMPHFNPENQFRYIAGSSNRPPLGLPNSTLRHVDKSGDFSVFVTVNKIGLRDKKDISQSRDTDIIITGDSFTMGYGVKEERRYSNILDEKIGPRVYNFAIPGDFVHYFNLIRYAEAHQSNAKRLIVGVSVEDDVFDYNLDVLTPTNEIEKFPPIEDLVGLTLNFNGLKRFLNRYSALYLATTTAIRNIRPLDLWLQKIGLVKPLATVKIDHDQEEYTSSANFLANMTTKYEAVIILLPSKSIWFGNNQNVFRTSYQRMKAALLKENLYVIDILPAFDETGHPLDYYFRSDPHWNEAGHRLAAETIYRQLPKSWRSNAQ